jgi:hypothetical protein
MVRLHGDLSSHSKPKHNNNNSHRKRSNLNSLNHRLNLSSPSNNSNSSNNNSNSNSNNHNNRLRLLGSDLDLACVLDHIIHPAHPLVVLCGAVLALALVLGLEVGSLVLVLRTQRRGIRLLRTTPFLRRRRARSCMAHQLHRIMGRESAGGLSMACDGDLRNS